MIVVPENCRVNTGDQSAVQKTIDDFFYDVAKELTHSKEDELCLRCDSFELYSSNNPTNGWLHAVFYKDVPVALVTQTRTEFNFVQYNFFYVPYKQP
jgi:hypothetical protein